MGRKISFILSGLLLVACLAIGFRLAYRKPLWNDEIFTQVSSVTRASYLKIITGHVGEGNNTPLFYLLQKGLCDLTGYDVPEPWLRSEWGHRDMYSQIFLRITPVMFMALSIVLIFHYFTRRHSIWVGLYSVAVSLSSFMIWPYWAEARPYALWVFLTTIQCLAFLTVFEGEGATKQKWARLVAINFLLSLTAAVSVIQITIVSLLLWIMGERHWRKYLLLFVIPAAICLTYYALAPHYRFWFKEGPLELMNAAFPKDRLFLVLVFGVYLGLSCLPFKEDLFSRLPVKRIREDDRKRALAYFWLTALMVLSCLALLLKFKLGESPVKHGFQISNRYFINLVPVSIIATTALSIDLVKGGKNKLMRGLILLLLAGLLLVRIVRTVQLV